ncbi:MAG: bile acid:sodium symporter [Mangrovibacterium sp.]|nr:bile acid:sodium symporter [Mangrovibacterium sp.]
MKRFRPDWFIILIALMILLAYLVPGIGSRGSRVELKTIIHYGIMLLFFFYGVKLRPGEFLRDLSNWRVHATIQGMTFVAFPVIVILFRPLLAGTEYELLWLAVFFLAALPSTVSSSVVMVSIARGNVPGAIFNASISGLLGILITPVWIGFFMEHQGEAFSFAEALGDLVTRILLPVCAGMAAHRFLGPWAGRNSHFIGWFDRSVILAIVYNSFSDSFREGIFGRIGVHELLILGGSVISLFFLVYELTRLLVRQMRFNREDGITVLFCASKKSLVHGSVFSSVLFSGTPYVSLFLVPIMIYHAFQLFYISVVAHRFGLEQPVGKR